MLLEQERSAVSSPTRRIRPCVRGKFIFVGDQKLYLRGVTYGTFAPDADGDQFPDRDTVALDFAAMAANGINTVRTYTVPPRFLLDAAEEYGLHVMVGLPWEQHIAFLDQKDRARAVEQRVRDGVRACAGHAAVLCYAVGNEIPASIVRWHGRRAIERFIERLYRAVKNEDPEGIVTYVNFPTTEYLQLPFLDLVCFNVYLESQRSLEGYLARLQNIAGDRPLVMAEIGLDSRQNGEELQGRALDWQIRTAFAAGCAGTFVFAWTDEWHRGGYEIENWDFGLTSRDRRPKPALASVRDAYAELPFPPQLPWPRISVVVCSFNGARTIRDCLDGLMEISYPDFEVIVVNDGSTDATPAIAAEYPFRLISTENRGLSSARNTGLQAASGEIIAYTDDDARPDPDWLTYLAATFLHSEHAGVGGPNIAPPGDGPIADCIANSPGGPVHVLLSDTVAEHIPGCNMALRTDRLRAIGGFDPIYRAAGDDVDVCWRLQERGWTLGFSPAAMVWHHRRNSVRMYWKQQQGYGKAEALLEQKWPQKYNAAGHTTWAGRLYGKGLTQALSLRPSRIYQGTWGSGLFQSIYEPAAGTLLSMPLMPEWYLMLVVLAVLGALGIVWAPLLWALPLLGLTIAASIVQAFVSAQRARFTSAPLAPYRRGRLRTLTMLLHLLQPLARLRGRLRYGLTPWRRRGSHARVLPWPRQITIWSEEWRGIEAWLGSLVQMLRASGTVAYAGGDFDRWDLHVRGGVAGAARLRSAVEEHGAGRQFIRFWLSPHCSKPALIVAGILGSLAVWASVDRAWLAAGVLAAGAILITLRLIWEGSAAMGAIVFGLRVMAENES